MVEPGLAIVADVMRLAARVIDLKQIRGKHFGVLSSSVYELMPTRGKRKLPMTVLTCGGPSHHFDCIDLVGYTCMEDDCLYPGYAGPLAVGDIVVFENAGAYTTVLKPPFIGPAPRLLRSILFRGRTVPSPSRRCLSGSCQLRS
jgi:diaminopimelate decarboxylase